MIAHLQGREDPLESFGRTGSRAERVALRLSPQRRLHSGAVPMTGLRVMPRLECENDAGSRCTDDPGRDSQRHGSRFLCGCCGYAWFCPVGGDAPDAPTGTGATPQISLAGRPLSAAEGAADQSIAPASRVSLAGGSSHLDGGPAQAPSRHSANSAATISSDIVARRMVKRASTRVYSRAAVRCAVILPMSLARLTLPSYSSAWRLSTLSVRAVLTSSPVAAATDSSMRLMAFRASSHGTVETPAVHRVSRATDFCETRSVPTRVHEVVTDL